MARARWQVAVPLVAGLLALVLAMPPAAANDSLDSGLISSLIHIGRNSPGGSPCPRPTGGWGQPGQDHYFQIATFSNGVVSARAQTLVPGEPGQISICGRIKYGSALSPALFSVPPQGCTWQGYGGVGQISFTPSTISDVWLRDVGWAPVTGGHWLVTGQASVVGPNSGPWHHFTWTVTTGLNYLTHCPAPGLSESSGMVGPFAVIPAAQPTP